VVAFFKVVQQQTIGKVGNLIICLWVIVKELLKLDSICESYAQMKRVKFF